MAHLIQGHSVKEKKIVAASTSVDIESGKQFCPRRDSGKHLEGLYHIRRTHEGIAGIEPAAVYPRQSGLCAADIPVIAGRNPRPRKRIPSLRRFLAICCVTADPYHTTSPKQNSENLSKPHTILHINLILHTCHLPYRAKTVIFTASEILFVYEFHRSGDNLLRRIVVIHTVNREAHSISSKEFKIAVIDIFYIQDIDRFIASSFIMFHP